MNKIRTYAPCALIIVLLFTCAVQAQTQTDALPTLRGDEAVEKLKDSGQYDSLMEAVRASRQANGQKDEPPAEDAVGQTRKLLASDAATNDVFGYSVAISGDTAVIGAYLEDTAPNSDNGAVYVFVRTGTTWTEQAKLLASDAFTSDFFGISVAISGDTAVIGAYSEDTAPNTDNGAAYVFVRSGTTWTQQAKLLASDAASFNAFGNSVAISGDTAVIGAPIKSTAPNSLNGAAYVFSRTGTTWTEVSKLTDSARADGDLFGRSVAISGDKIVVGADSSDASTSMPLNAGKDTLVPQAADQGAALFFIDAPLPILSANVSVGGQVTAGGKPLANALVQIVLPNGEIRTVQTGALGRYRFDEIPSGEIIVVSVYAGRYEFSPQVITVSEDISGLNFDANEDR